MKTCLVQIGGRGKLWSRSDKGGRRAKSSKLHARLR